MPRRILLILAGALAVALGVGAALVLTPNLPSGKLETAVTDVTVVAPPPTTETLPPETVAPPPEEDVDKRCWTMFGGGPRRELSRPAIDLGIPRGKPIWARGLKEYIEYPPSYCDGVLYVNTFRGDTWAIEAETGKVVWKKVSSAPKPSTPAIAGDKLIVSSKDGTVTALTRESGKLVWQLRTNAKVESSPAVAGDTVYFSEHVSLPFRPFPGTLSVAPAEPGPHSIVSGSALPRVRSTSPESPPFSVSEPAPPSE